MASDLINMMTYFIIGFTEAIQNIGLGIISILAGFIKDADETFVWLEAFFIAWASLAVLTTAIMWFTDFKNNNYLFMTKKQRKKFVKTKKYFDFLNIDMPAEMTNEEHVVVNAIQFNKKSTIRLTENIVLQKFHVIPDS